MKLVIVFAALFLAALPGLAQHEAIGWVWTQLQHSYFKAGDFDQSLATDEKLLGADAKDWQAALVSLQAAVGKKDLASVLKLAPMVAEGAQKASQSGKCQRRASARPEL